ncbi:hypothetical protein [Bradyrhizobium sp. 169]|uniref:hypothetical protein n=1 Tax=Bradyrhizobium sp. 169 TaxID=2782640 RepID=UPI001FFA2531|nr:hypothetical protein [Bradyrhizobium sp. 169]MCK1591095.1 hypothetical protein [Bradyrhizobium sp. 169]
MIYSQMTIFNYKVATNVPVTHSIYIRLKEATERIQTETNGQLNIRVLSDGRLGSDIDLVRQVLTGAVEFATLPELVLGNLIPIASLNGVGFVFSRPDDGAGLRPTARGQLFAPPCLEYARSAAPLATSGVDHGLAPKRRWRPDEG